MAATEVVVVRTESGTRLRVWLVRRETPETTYHVATFAGLDEAVGCAVRLSVAVAMLAEGRLGSAEADYGAASSQRKRAAAALLEHRKGVAS